MYLYPKTSLDSSVQELIEVRTIIDRELSVPLVILDPPTETYPCHGTLREIETVACAGFIVLSVDEEILEIPIDSSELAALKGQDFDLSTVKTTPGPLSAIKKLLYNYKRFPHLTTQSKDRNFIYSDEPDILELINAYRDELALPNLSYIAQIYHARRYRFFWLNDDLTVLLDHNIRIPFCQIAKTRTHFDNIQELFSDATEGMIRAAEMFDYKLGNRYSTYAWHWSSGTIRNSRMKDLKLPELSEWVISLRYKIRALAKEVKRLYIGVDIYDDSLLDFYTSRISGFEKAHISLGLQKIRERQQSPILKRREWTRSDTDDEDCNQDPTPNAFLWDELLDEIATRYPREQYPNQGELIDELSRLLIWTTEKRTPYQLLSARAIELRPDSNTKYDRWKNRVKIRNPFDSICRKAYVFYRHQQGVSAKSIGEEIGVTKQMVRMLIIDTLDDLYAAFGDTVYNAHIHSEHWFFNKMLSPRAREIINKLNPNMALTSE